MIFSNRRHAANPKLQHGVFVLCTFKNGIRFSIIPDFHNSDHTGNFSASIHPITFGYFHTANGG